MTIQSCAGGWCTKRGHCAHYHAASPDQEPSERLCPPGQDGAGLQSLPETQPRPAVELAESEPT